MGAAVSSRRRTGALVAALAVCAVACGPREERFESVVQVVRKVVVEKNPDGSVEQVDFELEWDPCPGDQYQVVRGGREFAVCSDKYEVGDYVPVIVKRYWDARGFYRWSVVRLGECSRTSEPGSFGSYEKSAECKDVVNYGRTVGFNCSRKPFRDLVKRCPWMERD